MSNQPNVTNNTQLENTDTAELLDLSHLFPALQNSWRFVVGSIFLFTVISLIIVLIVPKQWEATATLHVGRTVSITDESKLIESKGESKLIEDPAQTVARFKSIGFKHKILNRLHLPIEKGLDKKTDLLLDSLKATVIKDTEFVNLSARGYSADEAVQTLLVSTSEIKTIHAVIIKADKNFTLKGLQENKQNLISAMAEVAELKKQLSVARSSQASAAFAPSMVATSLLIAKEADVRALQTQKNQYTTWLATFDEQATAIINTVNVSKKPVFPKRSIFLVAGALVGFLVGGWIALLRYKKPDDATP